MNDLKYLEKYCVFGVISFVFLFFLSANFLFPPQSDDFDAYFQALNGIKSAIEGYLKWNARLGDLLYVGLIAKYNSTLKFDILSSFLGIGFFLSSFILFFGRLPKYYRDIPVMFLFFFFIIYFNAFGSDFLWGSGVFDNLFGTLMVILALIPYRIFWEKYFKREVPYIAFFQKYSVIKGILFFIFSFFAGWCVEVGGVMSIFIQICFLAFVLFYASKKGLKLPFWYYAGVIGFIIGFCMLYFAPGPRLRALYLEQFLTLGDFLKLSLFQKAHRIYITLKSFYDQIFATSCIFVMIYFFIKYSTKRWYSYVYFVLLCLVIYKVPKHYFSPIFMILALCVEIYFTYFLYKRKNNDWIFLLIIALLTLAWIIAGMSSFQVISIPLRSRLFDHLLLYGVMIYSFIKIYDLDTKYGKLLLGGGVLIVSLSYGLFVQSEYLKSRIRWENMLSYIDEQKIAGNKDIVVNKDIFKNRYENSGDFGNPSPNAKDWPNGTYSKFFGVDSFKAIEMPNDFHRD